MPQVKALSKQKNYPFTKEKTWGISLFFAFIGILFLLPYLRAAISPTPNNTGKAMPTLTLAPTFTQISCLFRSKPANRQPFSTGNLKGSITSPAHCETGIISGPQSPIMAEGISEQIPNDNYLWLLVYAPDGKYYPQCNDTPATKAENTNCGEWSMRTYLGYECTPYYIVLVATNREGTEFLLSTMNSWDTSNSYPGLRRDELKPYEFKELHNVQVETGLCNTKTPTP